MLYNQPKIPRTNCASCRDRACPARSLPPYPFYDSIRRGGIHPSRAPSPRRKRPRRPEGWPPYTPTSNPCVGRGVLTPPRFTGISLLRFIRREKSCPPTRGVGDAAPYNRCRKPSAIRRGRIYAARQPAAISFPLHAPSVHFPKFIHFFVKKSTQKIFFVL